MSKLIIKPRFIIPLLFALALVCVGTLLLITSLSIKDNFSELSLRGLSVFILLAGLMYIFSLTLEVINFFKSKQKAYLINKEIQKGENFSEFIKNGRTGVVVSEYIFSSINLKTFPYTTKQIPFLWLFPIFAVMLVVFITGF